MAQPLAYIHPDAKIGKNVTIEPFATIQGDVEIGDGSWIGSNVVIDNGARIGKNVRIFPGAVIATIPQDLKYQGEYTTVEIGDNCTIREYVTVNRGTKERGCTTVGKHVLLMAYAHIAHDCHIDDHAIIANAVNIAGHVYVGKFARLGGMCAVHQFVKIGDHVIISGGSLIRKDVPPYTKSGREPLSFVGVNTIGLRRGGFASDTIHNIQEMYRVVYLSGLNNSQAVYQLEHDFSPSPERDSILGFIRSSDRGIMKGYFSNNHG